MTAEERRVTFLWEMTLGSLPVLQLIFCSDVYMGRGNWTQVIFRKEFITMWDGDVLEKLMGPKGRVRMDMAKIYYVCNFQRIKINNKDIVHYKNDFVWGLKKYKN